MIIMVAGRVKMRLQDKPNTRRLILMFVITGVLALAVMGAVRAVFRSEADVAAHVSEMEKVPSVEPADKKLIQEIEKFADRDDNAQIGTKENPFLLLEIAPSQHMAMTAYLIKGCEPIKYEQYGEELPLEDLIYVTNHNAAPSEGDTKEQQKRKQSLRTVGRVNDKLNEYTTQIYGSQSGDIYDQLNSNVVQTGLYTRRTVKRYIYEDRLPDKEHVASYSSDSIYGQWYQADNYSADYSYDEENGNFAQGNYYEFVGEGNGNYRREPEHFQQVADGQGDYQAEYQYDGPYDWGNFIKNEDGSFTYVGWDHGGNYNGTLKNYEYVGAGNGNYQIAEYKYQYQNGGAYVQKWGYYYVGEGGTYQRNVNSCKYVEVGYYEGDTWKCTSYYSYEGTDENGEKAGNYQIELLDQEGILTASFTKTADGQGDYIKGYVDKEDEENHMDILTTRIDASCYQYNYCAYRNLNLLIRNAFYYHQSEEEAQKLADQFVSRSLIISPAQLNSVAKYDEIHNTDYMGMMMKAMDLLSITSQGYMSGIYSWYHGISKDEYENSPKGYQPNSIWSTGGDTNPDLWEDLGWSTVEAIMDRMGSAYPAALIMQQNAMFGNGSDCGFYNSGKLFVILKIYGAQTFKTLFMDGSLSKYMTTDETVTYPEDAAGRTYVTGCFPCVKAEINENNTPKDKLLAYYKKYLGNKNPKCWDAWTFQFYNNLGGNDELDAIFPERFEQNMTALPSGLNGEIVDLITNYNGDMSLMRSLLVDNIYKDANQNGNTVSPMFDFYEKEAIEKAKENGTYDENNNYRPDNLSFNDAIRYILNQYVKNKPGNGKEKKDKLRVLELQPCNEFIYGSPAWEIYYKNILEDAFSGSYVVEDGDLDVTCMTVAEFNGDIDDINSEYDLIIVGMKQDASNGADGYNDTALIKQRYTSMGDLVTTDDGHWERISKGVGAISENGSDASQMGARYSANDVTRKKYEELTNYLEAGKPIVMAKEFFSATPKVYVDEKTFVYKLAQQVFNGNEGSYTTLYNYSDIQSKEANVKESLCNALLYKYCTFDFDYAEDKNYRMYPTEYEMDENDHEVYLNPSAYSEKNKKLPAAKLSDIKADSQLINSDGKPLFLAQKEDGTWYQQLRYEFMVNGEEDSTYTINLYIDRNGNGIYSSSLKENEELLSMGKDALTKSEERVDDLTIWDISDNASSEYDTEHAVKVSNNHLKAGRKYVVTRVLPASEAGMLPWKLEIHDNANTQIRSSVIHYTAVGNVKIDDNSGSDDITHEKIRINVIQMNLLPNMEDMEGNRTSKEGGYLVDFSDQSSFPTKLNLSDYPARGKGKTGYVDVKGYERETTGQKFARYLEMVDDFDVHIYYKSNSWWKQNFDDSSRSHDENVKNWKNYLAGEYKVVSDSDEETANAGDSGVDMLIIGFMDSAVFTDNDVFFEGFDDFIKQGKSVILSHDIVHDASFQYMHPESLTNYDEWLRTLAGQRRKYYSALASAGDNSYTYIQPGVSIPSQILLKRETGANMDISNFTSLVTSDFGTGLTKSEMASEFMDNDTRLLVTYSNRSLKHDRVLDLGDSDNPSPIFGWLSAAAKTTKIRVANEGQVTSYPFVIGDEMQVSVTHSQNYQLDLEFDPEGDVTVWYNLADQDDGKNYGVYDARGREKGDSANNYYIYTKGNITYTGLGHTPAWTLTSQKNSQGKKVNIVQTQDALTDDEVKLFINTMIAAYRATPKAHIEVTNPNAAQKGDDYLLYALDNDPDSSSDFQVDFDIAKEGLTMDEGVKYYLSFLYQDPITKEWIPVEVEQKGAVNGEQIYQIKNQDELKEAVGYNPSPDITLKENGEKLNIVQVPSNDSDSSNAKYGVEIKKDIEYSFFVPKDDLDITFRTELTVVYYRDKRAYTKTSTKDIQIYKTPLFNLT